MSTDPVEEVNDTVDVAQDVTIKAAIGLGIYFIIILLLIIGIFIMTLLSLLHLKKTK